MAAVGLADQWYAQFQPLDQVPSPRPHRPEPLDIIWLHAAHPRQVNSLEGHSAEVIDAVESCSGFIVNCFAGSKDVYLDLSGLAVAAVEGGFVEEVDVAAGCGEEELVDAVAGGVGEVEEGEGFCRR